MFTENSHKVKPVQQDISEPLDTLTDAAEQAAAGAKAFVGYLLISRCLIDHEVVGFGKPGKAADSRLGCHSHAEAWQYLLMQASFKARTVRVGKATYNLSRGEAVVSERFLAERWNWSRKSVRGFVAKLGAQRMVKKGPQDGPKVPTLSICNYDKYQVASEYKGPALEGGRAQRPLKKGPNLKKVVKKEEVSNIGLLRNPHPAEGRAMAAVDVQPEQVAEAKPDQSPTAEPTKPDAKARAKAEAITRAFEVWAKLAAEYKFPACKSISSKRRSAMGERLSQVGGDVAEFENILRREISASEFLRGKVKPRPGSGFRQFELNIDFVLQPSAWDKMIDGAYSRKPGGARPTQVLDHAALDAHAARSIELLKTANEQARKQRLDRIRSNQGS